MRGYASIALTALALTVTLAACGGTGSVSPSPDATPMVTPDVVARGNGALEEAGRGIANGAGRVIEGAGNGLQSVGNGLQRAGNDAH